MGAGWWTKLTLMSTKLWTGEIVNSREFSLCVSVYNVSLPGNVQWRRTRERCTMRPERSALVTNKCLLEEKKITWNKGNVICAQRDVHIGVEGNIAVSHGMTVIKISWTMLQSAADKAPFPSNYSYLS